MHRPYCSLLFLNETPNGMFFAVSNKKTETLQPATISFTSLCQTVLFGGGGVRAVLHHNFLNCEFIVRTFIKETLKHVLKIQ